MTRKKLNLSADQVRAPVVEAALLRNLDIAGMLGYLTPGNLARMPHGISAVIIRGPYAGDLAEVDHVVPIAVELVLGNETASLDLLPRTLNRGKGAREAVEIVHRFHR